MREIVQYPGVIQPTEMNASHSHLDTYIKSVCDLGYVYSSLMLNYVGLIKWWSHFLSGGPLGRRAGASYEELEMLISTWLISSYL